MGDGPVLTGFASGYACCAYPATFADAAVADASGETVTVTLTFSDPGAVYYNDPNTDHPSGLFFFDPDAAADGSTYDAATGVFSVSGSASDVTAALHRLSFEPVGNGGEGFTLSAADADATASANGAFSAVTPGAFVSGGGLSVWTSQPIELTGTRGEPDVVHADGASAVVTLSEAQALFKDPVAVILDPTSIGNAATFLIGSNSARGDNGVYTLAADVSLTVYGQNADVTAQGLDDHVSFVGAGAAASGTVHGSHVTLDVSDAAVTLIGDGDVIDFANDDDSLYFAAPTSGDWNTLYASSGYVSLGKANLNIVGGGVKVTGGGPDAGYGGALSLYETYGLADVIDTDDTSVTLNHAQAELDGYANTVWFESGSDSTVTINTYSGAFDTVYGAGTIELASGGIYSVGGGALVDFQQAGETAYLSDTDRVWDRVQGAAGTTQVYSAQVSAYGGDQTIDFVGGEDNQASLYATDGDWDLVTGAASSLTVNDAQVNVAGAVQNIYLYGAQAEVSFYGGDHTGPNTVWGSGKTIIVNDDEAGVGVHGTNDTIYATSSAVQLYDGGAAWDTVIGSGNNVTLDQTSASVIGGGNGITSAGNTGVAVSLYDTNGSDDVVYLYNSTLTLTNASVYAEAGSDHFYFNAGTNNVDAGYYGFDDTFTFVGHFGVDEISDFEHFFPYGTPTPNVIELSKAQFADFAAFQAALTQQGDDAVLTYDADDKVVFKYIQATSITASQVKFV